MTEESDAEVIAAAAAAPSAFATIIRSPFRSEARRDVPEGTLYHQGVCLGSRIAR